MELSFVSCGREDMERAGLRELIALAMFEPDDVKIDAFLRQIDCIHTRMYLAVRDGGIVGQLTVSRGAEGRAEAVEPAEAAPSRETTIESLSVQDSQQGRGVGRFLITEYVKLIPDSALQAETDDDAVGFYHSLGFRVRSLGELHPGRERYHCVFDDHAFDPVPCREAVSMLEAAGIPCWIAGGRALDLFQGKETRKHEDTDILIRREDQERLFDAFPGWEIYRTHAPGLGHWNGVPFLDKTSNVWLRRTEELPWALEVMLMDVEDGEWVYRRRPEIRGRIDDMGLVTDDGIPYLRPEIQLLYKGGSSVRREKDTRDLLTVLPMLSEESRAWLARALRRQFPEGHEWLGYLE